MGKRFMDMLLKRANVELDNDKLELNPDSLNKLRGWPESGAADDIVAAESKRDF